MNTERYYRASELYSHPEIKARPARAEDSAKGIKARLARRAHPPRRGILPIGKTQFERLRASGEFPTPDAKMNGRPLWTGKLLNSVLMNSESDK